MANGDLTNRLGDIVSRHRLDEHWWHPNDVAVCRGHRDACDQLEDCVARTIEYGIEDSVISVSYATFARKQA